MAESNSSAIPTEEVASRRVGTVIKGKWTIDALLGTGGMATVYAATHRNGQRAALKIMHTMFARDREVVERFLREGYVSNKIGHAACVRVIDDDVTEEAEPFLVMELLEGETLRDLWKRTGKRVPLPQVMHVAERLLDCLAGCHAAGVIHRDLKPANIYVTNAGDVKVLDFGVALMKGVTVATAGMALGTPAYMSPEQAKGLADKIDHRVDIFSVGAVIHALASGKRVHRATNEQDALKMAATMAVPSVATIAPDLPQRVVALIDRALEWEPSARFADARAMQAEVIEIQKALKASPTVEAFSVETFHEDDEPMEALAEDHPRTFRARSVARALGDAIEATRARSRHDPEAVSAIDRAFEVIADALVEDRAVVLEVRQASFFAMGHPAWAPSGGSERVPQELYAAGVRALRFTRGVGPEDVTHAITLLGGTAELTADRDLASCLWDLDLPLIRAVAVSGFVAGDAQARERRTSDLLDLEVALGTAQRKHAHRLANPNLRAPSPRGPLSLDEETRARLEGELVLGEEALLDRHTDLMTAAMLDAAKHGEVPAVLGAIRRWAILAMSNGQHVDVMRAARALCNKLAHAVGPNAAPKLEAAVMGAAFGKEALVSALANQDESSRSAMAPVVGRITDADWPSIVSALQKPMSEQSASLLLELVARVARSKPAELAAATSEAPPPVRRAVRDWLTREGHRDAAAAVPAPKPGERAHAAETSSDEGLVLALSALAKLASNRQHTTAEYERTVGDAAGALARMPKQSATIHLEFAQSAIYVDGRVARLSQSGFDSAMELASLLSKDGARILSLPRSATADDLRRFGADIAANSNTSVIKRSAMSEVGKTYGADLPHLTIEQRLVGSAAALTRSLQAIAEVTRSGPHVELPALARAARCIVDDSVGTTAALLGLGTYAPDTITTKVAAAVVAVAAAREITQDRATLAAIVVGAALSVLPRPALLVGLGCVDPTSAAGVIAHEAARALNEAEPPDASFAAELVATATRWADLRATQSYDEAVRELANDARLSPFALRAICASMGIIPGGTIVELSDGEIAEVLAANEEDGARPRVRRASDSRVIELELEDELKIARVLEMDGWKTGPTMSADAPSQRADDANIEGDESSQKAHSFVRESADNEPAPTAEGTLATTPLLHVLVYVLDRSLSGTLEFRESEGTRHLVALTNGTPTRVVTGRLIAPLGSQLEAEGKLSDVQAASAITNAKSEGMALGQYLVREGKLTEAELQRALEVQVRRKLAGLVNLADDATYAFYKDTDRLEVPPSAHTLDVDALDVILEGVRAWTQRDRIRETLNRYAKLPLALHAESTPEAMDLSAAELAVLEKSRNESVTLASLMSQPPMDASDLMSLMYTLVITRQIVVPGQVKGPLGAKPWKVRRPAPPLPRSPGSPPVKASPPKFPQTVPFAFHPAPPPSEPLVEPPAEKPPIERKRTPKVARVMRDETMKDIVRIEQHLARKDIPTAAQVASRAVTEDSADPDLKAISLWIKALSATLKPAEVIAQLGVILLDFPDCTRARLFRAKLYKRDNARLRDAVADFEQVLVDDPTNKDAASEVRLLRLMVKPSRL